MPVGLDPAVISPTVTSVKSPSLSFISLVPGCCKENPPFLPVSTSSGKSSPPVSITRLVSCFLSISGITLTSS